MGLSHAKSYIKKIKSKESANKRIKDLEIWFKNNNNTVEKLKDKKFDECWKLLILK